MSGHWRNRAIIFLLLALLFPVRSSYAQLPALNNLAVDESGLVVVFYPDNWAYTPLEDGFVVSDSAINISVEVLRSVPAAFDELPEWVQATFDVPEEIPFRKQIYGGIEGWLVQNAGLFSEGVHSALVILPAGNTQAVIVRSDSRIETLSQDAPLITAILDKMMLLTSEEITTDRLTVRLPANWTFQQVENSLYIAPAMDDVLLNIRGSVPRQLGAVLQIRDASVETLLATDAPSEQRDFRINGRLATLQIRLNSFTQATELLIVQEMENGTPLLLTASSADGQNLVRFLSHLQAIFASAAMN